MLNHLVYPTEECTGLSQSSRVCEIPSWIVRIYVAVSLLRRPRLATSDRKRRACLREALFSRASESRPIVACTTKGRLPRLSWYGHIGLLQRDIEDITRIVLDNNIPGKRPRGRPASDEWTISGGI